MSSQLGNPPHPFLCPHQATARHLASLTTGAPNSAAAGSGASAGGALDAHSAAAAGGLAGVGVGVPPSGFLGPMQVVADAASLHSNGPHEDTAAAAGASAGAAAASAAAAGAGLDGAPDRDGAGALGAALVVEEHLPLPPSVDASVAAALAAFVGSGFGPAAGMAGIAPDVRAAGRAVTLEDSTLSSVELMHAKWGDPMCPSGGPTTRNTTASGAAAGHGAAGSALASQASTAANAAVWATSTSSNGNAAGSFRDGLAFGPSLGLGPDLWMGMGLGLGPEGPVDDGVSQGLLGATEESDMSQSDPMGQLGVVVLGAPPVRGVHGRRAGGGGGGGSGSGGASPNALAAGLVSFPVLPVGVGVLPGSAAVGGGSGVGGSGGGGGSGGAGGWVSSGGGGGGRPRGPARSSSSTSLELRKAAVVAAAVAAVAGDGGGGGGRSIGGPSMGTGGGSLEPVSEVDSEYMSL